MIKNVAFIAYAVRDVSRAVAFYRDVVGLPPGKAFNEATLSSTSARRRLR